MKPYITVENCLSFGHEYGSHDHENYFDLGSVVRKKVFLEREKQREEQLEEQREKQRLDLGREKQRLERLEGGMEGMKKRPRES